MKKNIVVSLKNDNIVSDLTLKTIQNYSKKLNSDFKLLEFNNLNVNTFLEINHLLSNYSRVLYISPHILVREDAPNLFDIVPENLIGLFNEGRYVSRDEHMRASIVFYREKLNKDWNGEYYSSDVMVLSKYHRNIINKIEDLYGDEFDPYFNLLIHKQDIKVFKLSFKFNRKEYIDSQIGISRLDSYLINYSDAPESIVRDIVEKDIIQWNKDKPNYQYPQNILIRLSAGLGDQIESEPVARYVRKIYPDANIFLTTHHPRIFKHLEKYNISVYDYSTWEGINDALIIMENNPETSKSINRLTQVLFHPTDYSSISMIRRTIPNEDKQIHIEVEASEIQSVLSLLQTKSNNKKSIVVHPGKWWPSKTFPKQWWQKVIDLLSEKLVVILIGKTLSDNQGYLDVKTPKDGFDFRDFTTLGENIALISLSKVTLSNDSSPIHIAGAFDNWIVTIPTCKHPDHILPWRNGSQTYKTKTLYKKLLQDDLEVRHTEFYFDTIDMLPKNKTIDEYLPTPEEIVDEIFKIYDEIDNNK